MSLTLRDYTPADATTIVQLNAAEVQHTSPMDQQRLQMLDACSCYHKLAELDGQVAAFLLALPQGGNYDSENYRWFCRHYPEFIYVDRIVVDANFSGMGIGRALYRDLFETARAAGVARIACEYNVEPPNEPSRRFHDSFGFSEVGSQWLDGNSKRVSLQLALS